MSLTLSKTENSVTTITMNNPRRLNGWTAEMMVAVRDALEVAASDENTAVVVLTGTDPYYCAGVNLSGVMKLGVPRKLHAEIVEQNRGWFEVFLDFPKPIIAAINGPAIGAAVTSATLCDALVASDKATFSTPFAKLGVPPEGCSSEFFPRLIGEENTKRMMGPEGWKPTGKEAEEIGLADQVVPHDDLLETAQKIAEGWTSEGRERTFRDGADREELKRINAAESIELADAFLGTKFLNAQFEFLWSKKKRGPALLFWGLAKSRPAWKRLL